MTIFVASPHATVMGRPPASTTWKENASSTRWDAGNPRGRSTPDQPSHHRLRVVGWSGPGPLLGWYFARML
jgi:hypothetical protein